MLQLSWGPREWLETLRGDQPRSQALFYTCASLIFQETTRTTRTRDPRDPEKQRTTTAREPHEPQERETHETQRKGNRENHENYKNHDNHRQELSLFQALCQCGRLKKRADDEWGHGKRNGAKFNIEFFNHIQQVRSNSRSCIHQNQQVWSFST